MREAELQKRWHAQAWWVRLRALRKLVGLGMFNYCPINPQRPLVPLEPVRALKNGACMRSAVAPLKHIDKARSWHGLGGEEIAQMPKCLQVLEEHKGRDLV